MSHGQKNVIRIPAGAAIALFCIVLITATARTTQAQNTTYAMTNSGVFGTLNLSNGTFNQIGNSAIDPAGMAGLGGSLYVALYEGSTLYQVNPSNGNLAALGTGSATYYEFGGTINGLYAIGTDENLYSVNASNGATTLIGPTGFPSGHSQSLSGGQTGLYAVVSLSTGDILYSLDTTAGAANEIGNTGITSNVTSISFYQGQLYACDAQGNLYAIDVINGQATLIANSGQDIWGLGAPNLSPVLAVSSASGGLCGTINLANGQWTQLSSGTVVAGIGQSVNMYGGAYQGNTLYQVNPANCTYTAVGNGTVTGGYRDFGATTGELYGIAQDSASDLYSVNPSTGATTFIGPTNLPFNGGQGVSANCPVLYATAQPNSDSALYLINTTTGAATEIGDTGVGAIDALVCENGTLYGATLTGNLYTLNLTTGQATFVAATEERLYGMAYLLYETLTVTTSGNGTVTSTDGFINCPGTCSHTYPAGTQVTLNSTPGQGWAFSGWTGACSGVGPCNVTITQNQGVTGVFVEPGHGIQFTSVTPCRLVDTRGTDGPFGGPAMQGNTTRNFALPQNPNCNVPANAVAYSLNVTVVPHGRLGYLSIWPTGEAQPVVSTMNSPDGRTKANAAIVPAGNNGAVSVYVTNTTDVILDIDGYFQEPGSGTYQFYPLTPCRLVDTRGADGPLGGPRLPAQQERDFPLLMNTACIPQGLNPVAYSLNFTVVPNPAGQRLGYLSVWPAGQAQPVVSTLNNPTATVVANAAIVPAGENGKVAVYAYNTTDLLIDINGYFATPGSGGSSLYPAAPCRAYDSRNNNGQPFSGERTVNIVGSPCAPPSNATGYVFNATVVPSGRLGFLSLWPDSEQMPVVSTLNAQDGVAASNMAIVPNLNGSIDAYAGNGATQLILDISGYFAP
jgi:hypothetical protein